MSNLNFNEKLKYYREKSNISKSELARIIGVSPSYITKLENGEKTNPSLGVQLKLANALKCPISNLTGENKNIREYILQLLLDNGFSLEEISKNVDVPVSELKNIIDRNPYDNENGLKLIKNLPKLFLTTSEDIDVTNADTLLKKASIISNESQDKLKETHYSEIIKAFKIITTYTNSNLNEELDSLTTEQIDKLKKVVSDYTEFQIEKILQQEK